MVTHAKLLLLRLYYPVACLLTCSATSAHVPVSTPQANDSVALLHRQISAILRSSALRTGFTGVFIQSLRDGKTLFESDADRVFLPASNNKLLTSAAALEILSPAFAYSTRLLRAGDLDASGTIHGDLVVQGSGDPTLLPDDLTDLVKHALTSGVRHVTGRLLYDDTGFDHQRLGEGWTWDDEPYYYSAQISALNLNENVVDLYVTPGSYTGAPVNVRIQPTEHYTPVVNAATTGPSHAEPRLTFQRDRNANVITISGSLPIDASPTHGPTASLTIDNPSRFAATVLCDDLRTAGVVLDHAVPLPSATPTNAVVLAEHRSPPLSSILRLLNKRSDNLIAECLLKTIGEARSSTGAGGVAESGPQAAREVFRRAKLDLDAVVQVDGSGLSRMNYVSPRNLVRLLAYIHETSNFSILYDSLPLAGVDGTLAHRLKGTAAANNCHAKTGSLSHVSALSGYVTSADGELLAFSILMNNQLAPARACTEVQDRIVALLASFRVNPNRATRADPLSNEGHN